MSSTKFTNYAEKPILTLSPSSVTKFGHWTKISHGIQWGGIDISKLEKEENKDEGNDEGQEKDKDPRIRFQERQEVLDYLEQAMCENLAGGTTYGVNDAQTKRAYPFALLQATRLCLMERKKLWVLEQVLTKFLGCSIRWFQETEGQILSESTSMCRCGCIECASGM